MKGKDVVKELSEKYNKKENMIKIMFEETIELGYNENDFENLLEEFYNKYQY